MPRFEQKKVAAVGVYHCPTLAKDRRVETIDDAVILVAEVSVCFFCGQLPRDCNFGIVPD
jgi:hypothetical protein